MVVKSPKGKQNYLALLFGFLFLISAALNGYFLIRKPLVVTPDYLVIGVYDGDTFVIEGKNKVRLRQVDAPELGNCGGVEAKEALVKLIDNKRVKFANEIPDQWGRKMAFVYVDGEMVNKTLLTHGLVRYQSDATPYTDELHDLAKQAKAAKLGLYGQCQTTEPKDPNCIIKGNIDPGDGTRRYYLPNCAQYKTAIVEEDIGEQWFCTEAEAIKAGYHKAKTCK